MSETKSVDSTKAVQTLTGTARVAFVISGLIAAVVGVLLLVWPGRTPQLTVGSFAIYAVSAGVTGVVLGMLGRGLASWRRGGHALIGLLLVVAGIVALSGIDTTRTNTGTILGVVVGIVWIVQGVFSVAETDRSKDTLWSIIFGVVSVLAGIAVLISPLWGTELLWVFFGVTLVVLGIAQLVRGERIGEWTSNPVRPERAAPAPKTQEPKTQEPKTPAARTPGRTSQASESPSDKLSAHKNSTSATPTPTVLDAPVPPASTAATTGTMPAAGQASVRPEVAPSGGPRPGTPDPSGPASGPAAPSGPASTDPGAADPT